MIQTCNSKMRTIFPHQVNFHNGLFTYRMRIVNEQNTRLARIFKCTPTMETDNSRMGCHNDTKSRIELHNTNINECNN